MGIELDIADVLEEVGVSFTIERLGTPLSGVVEYLAYKANSQVTKPFIREFFLECAFVADTAAQVGDIITFQQSGDSYFVMNLSPDFFEDTIIRNLVVLYKSNVTIDIYHPQFTTTGYDSTFDFQLVHSAQKALVISPVFGNVDAFDANIGSYNLAKSQLYLPIGYNLEEQDRIVLNGTSEVFRVETIIKRRFPNMIVSDLGEDTRE